MATVVAIALYLLGGVGTAAILMEASEGTYIDGASDWAGLLFACLIWPIGVVFVAGWAWGRNKEER